MKQNKLKVAVYAGSFDPFSLGHLDIAKRASKIVDVLYIAIGINPLKSCLYSVEQRKEMIRLCTQQIANVKVDSYDGLLINFCKSKNAAFIVRGLRNLHDYENEKSLHQLNKSISNDTVDTVYFYTEPNLAHISSSAIKQLLQCSCDLSAYVPRQILHILQTK